MRLCLLSAALVMLISPAIAATAPPVPITVPPPKTETISMTQLDLQVAIISIANAGAACDANVTAYCQLASVRADTLQKLQKAFADIQKPDTPPPAAKK